MAFPNQIGRLTQLATAAHLSSILIRLAVVGQHARLKTPRQQRCKAQIPDFDLAGVSIDVYFVTAQVAVNYGRRLTVQVAETQQHLQQQPWRSVSSLRSNLREDTCHEQRMGRAICHVHANDVMEAHGHQHHYRCGNAVART